MKFPEPLSDGRGISANGELNEAVVYLKLNRPEGRTNASDRIENPRGTKNPEKRQDQPESEQSALPIYVFIVR